MARAIRHKSEQEVKILDERARTLEYFVGFDSPYCRVAELADAVGLKPTDFGRTSSSLVTTTILGLLAQLVEQGTFNPKV